MAKKFTEAQARKYIKQRLLEEDWNPETVDTILEAIENMDGFWSWGTHRAIKDLEQIYGEMKADHGEAPDGRW